MKATQTIITTDNGHVVEDVTAAFAFYLAACDGNLSAAEACFLDDMNEGRGKGERTTWIEVLLTVTL